MNANEASRVVVDAAIKVHSALGPGLLESVYETCLAHELETRGIEIERQLALPVRYGETVVEAGLRIDLLVERCLVLEIKAVESLLPIHSAQLLTYLKLGNHPLGLLLNFNVVRMKDGIKRLANGLHE
jgi:GxxExxY protein